MVDVIETQAHVHADVDAQMKYVRSIALTANMSRFYLCISSSTQECGERTHVAAAGDMYG